MGYIGMFHSEGYGFQALYSRIGYKESLYSRKLINWLKILVQTRQSGIVTQNQNQKQGVAVTQQKKTQNEVDCQDQTISKETKCPLLKCKSTLQNRKTLGVGDSLFLPLFSFSNIYLSVSNLSLRWCRYLSTVTRSSSQTGKVAEISLTKLYVF